MNEKQAERIRETIKVYRARLTGEKRRFGGYFDNGGIRYVIPELYLYLRDYKGALSYYRWFSREFPGDSGFPAFNLFCAFILYQNKKIREAIQLSYKTAFSNTYLVDLLCNKPVVELDKSESDITKELTYAKEIIEGCDSLLTKEFRRWLCNLSETEEFSSVMNKYISIQKLLKDNPEEPLWSQLIDEASRIQRQVTASDD
jgi:hypothetical protein